jgi:hypothetical protein
MATKIKLYNASAYFDLYGHNNVLVKLFVPYGDRPFDPKDYMSSDDKDGRTIRAISEAFTKEEADQLVRFFAKYKIDVTISEIGLSLKSRTPLESIGDRGNGKEGYILFNNRPDIEYMLPFIVQGYYDLEYGEIFLNLIKDKDKHKT